MIDYITQWNRKTKNLSNGVKAIFLSHNLFDLFYGDGWENRYRFKIDRKTKQVTQVGGQGKAPAFLISTNPEIYQ